MKMLIIKRTRYMTQQVSYKFISRNKRKVGRLVIVSFAHSTTFLVCKKLTMITEPPNKFADPEST